MLFFGHRIFIPGFMAGKMMFVSSPCRESDIVFNCVKTKGRRVEVSNNAFFLNRCDVVNGLFLCFHPNYIFFYFIIIQSEAPPSSGLEIKQLTQLFVRLSLLAIIANSEIVNLFIPVKY